MVEMRWVVRQVKGLPPEFNSLSPNAKEKVLQYRYDRSTTAGIRNWSEWIYVPTVVEEKNNG